MPVTSSRFNPMLKTQRGATMVEFAFAALVLLLVFGALFDVGLGIHRYAIIKHVTSEATRMIAADLQTHRQCTQVRHYLENFATPKIRDSLSMHVTPHWTMNWLSGGARSFDVMAIRADFNVKCYFLCPFATNGGWPVSTTSEIVIERKNISCSTVEL